MMAPGAKLDGKVIGVPVAEANFAALEMLSSELST